MKIIKTLVFIFFIIGIISFFKLHQTKPIFAQTANTYYIDPNVGNDSNPGTQAAPWKTIEKAAGKGTIPPAIKSGDKVILASGIYRITPGNQGIANLTFGPAGSPGSLTIFQAAAGARPIITSTADYPVGIHMEDYVRIDGLWFGGKRHFCSTDPACTLPEQKLSHKNGVLTDEVPYALSMGSTSNTTIGKGKEVVNITLWNYSESGLVSGFIEYSLIQNNRLVNNGSTNWTPQAHATYFTGADGQGDRQLNHIIVDHNIILGGHGYGLHGYHVLRNFIYSRNFVADQMGGGALDGTDHLWVNNFFWKMNFEYDPINPWGPNLTDAYNQRFYNNIMGPLARILSDDTYINNKNLDLDTNAQTNYTTSFGTLTTDVKKKYATSLKTAKNFIYLNQGSEASDLGISETTLDNTISALKNSFADTKIASDVFNDTTIEGNFATIRGIKIPSSSPLYGKGKNWFGTGAINLGPDSSAPSDVNGFWTAFNAYGFQNCDQSGNRVGTNILCGPFPSGTPTPGASQTGTTNTPIPSSTPGSALGNGDVNKDGKVNEADMQSLFSNWLVDPLTKTTLVLDQYPDGVVNSLDFGVVMSKVTLPTPTFIPTSTGVPTSTSVPIPTSSAPTSTPPPAGSLPNCDPSQNGGKYCYGFIGCSNSMQAIEGYNFNSVKDRFWPRGASFGGGGVQEWANTGGNWWKNFDDMVAKYGTPKLVWVNYCLNQAVLYTDLVTALNNLRSRVPNAQFYISPLNRYDKDAAGNPYNLCGPANLNDNPNKADNPYTWADRAVSEGLTQRGPDLPSGTTKLVCANVRNNCVSPGDNCHLSSDDSPACIADPAACNHTGTGTDIVGDQMVSFFDR